MVHPLDDIRRAKLGDRAALDRVLLRLQGRLEQVAHQRLGAELRTFLDTADLLQSAYLDVVRGIRTLEADDEETFVGWVVRIIERNAQDRRRWLRAGRRRAPAAGPAVEPDLDAIKDPAGRTPSQHARTLDDLLLVSRALAQLRPDQRRVLEMRLIENRSHEEIAAALGRTEQATRSLLLRARATLLMVIERLRAGARSRPS